MTTDSEHITARKLASATTYEVLVGTDRYRVVESYHPDDYSTSYDAWLDTRNGTWRECDDRLTDWVVTQMLWEITDA